MKTKMIKVLALVLATIMILGALVACNSGTVGPAGAPGEKGDQGEKGDKGEDGLTPTVEISEDGYWIINGIKTDIKATGIDNSQGPQGEQGEKGDTGADGVGIQNIELVSSDNNVDTYKITYTNNTVTTFTVTNGVNGADGVGISGAEINSDGELILVFTDENELNLGKIVGANGADGKNGVDGVGISNVALDGNNLVITLSNGTTIDLGNIKGEDGKDGIDGTNGTDGKDGVDGISVTKSEINANGELVFTFSDGNTVNVGKVVGGNGTDGTDGTDGKNGVDGVGISNVTLEENNLIITLSNGTIIDLGNIKGADGKDGINGLTPFIGENGNWWIGDTDTGVKAQGEQGVQGGKGDEGDTGATIAKVEFDDQGRLVITLTNGTVLDPIEMPERKVYHTVAFDLGYSSYYKTPSQTVLHGEKAIKPQDPTRDGYMFKGWYLGDERWSFIGYTVNENITLEARWAPVNGYAINYVLGGGTNSPENPSSYTIGSAFTFKDPTRAGYTFNGWYTSADYLEKMLEVTPSTRGDIVLYARWTPLVKYELNSTGGITIRNFQTTDTDIVIPAEIDGYPVTEIGPGAFSQKYNVIKSVTIPNTVKIIREQAFYISVGIEKIIIPEGVEIIEDGAFWYCVGVRELHIPASVTYIGNGAIPGNAMILTVDEDNTVYHSAGNCIIETATGRLIGGCSGSVIPNDGSVKVIATLSFIGARRLNSLTIPESVEKIEDAAFSTCENLVEIYNYSRLQITAGNHDNGRVAEYADNVYTTAVASNIVQDSEGFVFYINANSCYLMCYRGDKTSLILPESYNGMSYGVRDYAFLAQRQIEEVVLPDGLLSIGDYAFAGNSIKSLVIPDSVISVGSGIFNMCYELEYVVLPSGATIGGLMTSDSPVFTCAFYRGTEDEWNKLKSSSQFDDSVVYYYSALRPANDAENYWRFVNGVPMCWKDIKDSEGLTFQANSEGYTLTGMGSCTDETVIVPAYYNGLPVTMIGSSAFSGKTITDIVLPTTVRTIRYHAFSYCENLTEIVLPEGITDIDEGAFAYCRGLKSIILPQTLQSIGSIAFEYTDITVISIPNSVTYLSDWSFLGCRNLETLILGNGIDYIGSSTFYGCNKLSEVYYTGSEEEWNEMTVYDGTISYCAVYFYLESSPVEEGIYWHYGEDGKIEFWPEFLPSKGLYFELNDEGDGYILMGMGECTDTKVVVPYIYEGLPVVGIDRNFNLPDTVTSITVSGNIKTVTAWTLYDNQGLEEVIFLEGVETIENMSFQSTQPLKKLVLPASIKYIGWCFTYDENTQIYYCGTSEEWKNVENNTNINPMFTLSVGQSFTYSSDDPVRGYYIIPKKDMDLTVTFDIDPWNAELYLNGETVEYDEYYTDEYNNSYTVYKLELSAGEIYSLEFYTGYGYMTVTIE